MCKLHSYNVQAIIRVAFSKVQRDAKGLCQIPILQMTQAVQVQTIPLKHFVPWLCLQFDVIAQCVHKNGLGFRQETRMLPAIDFVVNMVFMSSIGSEALETDLEIDVQASAKSSVWELIFLKRHLSD